MKMHAHRIQKVPLLLGLAALALVVLPTQVNSNPLKSTAEAALQSSKELDDLNKANTNAVKKETATADVFQHRDEDMPRQATDLELNQSLKYDVEVLEVRDIKQETAELEERFRGPAIKMDTDNFAAEDIEVNDGNDGNADEVNAVYMEDAIGDAQQSHLILTIILVFVALISITLYVTLVIWRASLEQRYGMRELLVTNDDDFCPQLSDDMVTASNRR